MLIKIKGIGHISPQKTQISIRVFVLVAKIIKKNWADKGFNEGKH